jgi:glycosyltransferase involved in cell wall biosynthesis
VLLVHGDRGVPWSARSGAGAHLRGLAGGFVSLGWDVVAAVPFAGQGATGDLPARVVPFGAPHRVGGRLAERVEALGGWWAAPTLRRLGAFDLVIQRHAGFADPGAWLGGGAPRLVELDAPIAAERARWGRLGDPSWAISREQRLLRGARVGAVSPWLVDFARAAGAAEARLVPNGSAVTARPDRDALREELGVLSGLVLWFGGSPRPWHGLDLLPALLDHLPGATAVIAGEGEVPAHPRIRALGWLDGPAHDRWIAASDVAVLPYPADAPPWFCPLKGFDARAGGLPIVASDVAAVRDHAARWGETTLVPSDDVAAWSRAIAAAAARPRVVNARTWIDVARAWVAFGGLGGG